MHTFTKTRDLENHHDLTEVTVETAAVELPDLLAAFEDYLRGCGYCFDGKVDIVPDETDDLP